MINLAKIDLSVIREKFPDIHSQFTTAMKNFFPDGLHQDDETLVFVLFFAGIISFNSISEAVAPYPKEIRKKIKKKFRAEVSSMIDYLDSIESNKAREKTDFDKAIASLIERLRSIRPRTAGAGLDFGSYNPFHLHTHSPFSNDMFTKTDNPNPFDEGSFQRPKPKE